MHRYERMRETYLLPHLGRVDGLRRDVDARTLGPNDAAAVRAGTDDTHTSI
jgi:hypothetical protein